MDKKLFLEEATLEKNDTLLIIDMQNDFVDRPYKEKSITHKKGKLPTHDSKRIIPGIVRLMDKFRKSDSYVVATRDYHPKGKMPHCSFPIFGEHCVQGTKGSDVVKEIENKMVIKGSFMKKHCIVYKADNPKIDSFGAFPYTKKLGNGRICGCNAKKCPTQFTGSWGLSKYQKYPKNTPSGSKIPLTRILKGVSKKDNYIFICGVLGDFCVLDTARNARAAGYKNVVIVIDLIRSLRLVENGKVKYPTTPKMYCEEARKHGFYFIMSGDISQM